MLNLIRWLLSSTPCFRWASGLSFRRGIQDDAWRQEINDLCSKNNMCVLSLLICYINLWITYACLITTGSARKNAGTHAINQTCRMPRILAAFGESFKTIHIVFSACAIACLSPDLHVCKENIEQSPILNDYLSTPVGEVDKIWDLLTKYFPPACRALSPSYKGDVGQTRGPNMFKTDRVPRPPPRFSGKISLIHYSPRDFCKITKAYYCLFYLKSTS